MKEPKVWFEFVFHSIFDNSKTKIALDTHWFVSVSCWCYFGCSHCSCQLAVYNLYSPRRSFHRPPMLLAFPRPAKREYSNEPNWIYLNVDVSANASLLNNLPMEICFGRKSCVKENEDISIFIHETWTEYLAARCLITCKQTSVKVISERLAGIVDCPVRNLLNSVTVNTNPCELWTVDKLRAVATRHGDLSTYHDCP